MVDLTSGIRAASVRMDGPTPDPTMTSGNREQILTAYRGVRDGLFRRIKHRFPVAGAPNV